MAAPPPASKLQKSLWSMRKSLKTHTGRKKYGKVAGEFLLPPSIKPTNQQQKGIGKIQGERVKAQIQKKKASSSSFKGLANLYS
ncbi:hypothetical protein EON65_21455 [archaeon]|nr:MAG: hypothetical protein EON65_21455 [archaeon]